MQQTLGSFASVLHACKGFAPLRMAATRVAHRLLASYRKVILNVLAVGTTVTAKSALRLLGAIARLGTASAKELLRGFDFTLKCLPVGHQCQRSL